MNIIHEQTCKSTFSWKAPLIGALLAFGLLLLFNLLTVGGGLASYVRSERGLETLVALAYLWTAIGSFLILFLSGMVTSMLIYPDCCTNGSHNGMLHGFITWVFYILISLTFLSHLSEASIIAFPKNFFTQGVSSDTTSRASASSEATETFSTAKAVAKGDTSAATQRKAQKLGVATLAAFFIFALEAMGACFGAWCGMDVCRRYCYPNRKVT